MKPVINITEDIIEYCIACLDKGRNMYNLNENMEKRKLFTTLFDVELTKYREYPQFLCYVCDVKLNVAHNFQETVRRCLAVLEEYNEKLVETTANNKQLEQENIKEEDLQATNNDVTFYSEDETHTANEKVFQRIPTSKIEAVSPGAVKKVVEEFRNKLTEKKTCLLCGFIAANRRAISSHMAIFHKEVKNSWCLECNNIFENVEKHKQIHNNKYKCPFCEKETNISHYVEHLQSHAGIFKCEYCSKTFKSAAWLTKHTRIHTNDKPYICPNCSKCFIQISSLRYHVSTHGKFSCDNCKKHYKTEKELTQHECSANKNLLVPDEIWIKTDDGNENDEEIGERVIIKEIRTMDSTALQNFCKDCNKRVKSLNQHIKKYHTLAEIDEDPVIKDFQCEFCEKTYTNSYKLKVHIRTHTGELPYECKYCEKRTINRSRLKDHERTHTKEKPYMCSVCGKRLSQASALRTHMRRHTGKPELCELCNKRFCRKSELKLHLSKHMGEKPFLCTECGKTFAQRSHLTEHMAGHGEARPYQCTYCQKSFKKNLLLKDHLKLHQGHKPFKCSSCPYACYKAYRLQQHMKQHSADAYEGIKELQVKENSG